MASNKNFDYLGSNFQIQLLNQIVVDKDFSRSIIDVIETNYFENKLNKCLYKKFHLFKLNMNCKYNRFYCYFTAFRLDLLIIKSRLII